MALLKKDPERERVKQEEAEQRAKEAAEAAFWASPQGQARAAIYYKQAWFQVALPLSVTQRTTMGVLSGSHQDVRRTETLHNETISLIESEGWQLWHVGYVWQQTGSVSRDKMLSSGQVAAVTGEIIGIYLFKLASGHGQGQEEPRGVGQPF